MNYKVLGLSIALFTLSGVALADTATTPVPAITEQAQRGLYLGIFGGGSASESTNMTQSGIAFHTPPENVSVQGTSQSKTGGIGGLHLGYEWSEIPMGSASGWGLRPAVEIEGYYLGTSQSGGLKNPQAEPTVSIGHHTFTDSSNLNMGVLLANAIFTFKTPWFKKIFPYVGGVLAVQLHQFQMLIQHKLELIL